MWITKTDMEEWPYAIRMERPDEYSLYGGDNWCYKNLGEKGELWNADHWGWLFYREEDAMLFLLTWG